VIGFVTFVTSQLSGSQDRPSFLPGTGERLNGQGLSRALCCPAMIVWARDGQAPARAQTHNVVDPAVRETSSTVQYLHRLAAIGIELRHSGQSRSVASLAPCSLSTSFAIGATIRK
jgi:hypothetical protein